MASAIQQRRVIGEIDVGGRTLIFRSTENIRGNVRASWRRRARTVDSDPIKTRIEVASRFVVRIVPTDHA